MDPLMLLGGLAVISGVIGVAVLIKGRKKKATLIGVIQPIEGMGK